MERIKVTLVKSPIDYKYDQKSTVKGLGLTKIRQCRIHNATPQILGMINKVKHLVKVEKVEGGE